MQQVEGELARSILRPIGFNDEPNTAELRSFVDWAAIPDSRLKLRVLEVAFENPETALRVARRADRVAQTCVTLSPPRRQQAIDFLSAQQRRPDADPRIRTAAAWLALELGSSDLPALSEALIWLSNYDANDRAATPRAEFSDFMDVIIARLPNSRREQIIHIQNAFITVLEQTTSSTASSQVCNCLVPLVPTLNAEQVDRGCDAIIAILNESEDFYALKAAADILAELTPKLSSEQVTRGWNALVIVMGKSEQQNNHYLIPVEHGLFGLAPKLTADQISHSWARLIAVLQQPTKVYQPPERAGKGLVALAPFIGEEQLNRGCNSLLTVFEDSANNAALAAAANALVALHPRLSREQNTQVWDTFINILQTSEKSNARQAARMVLVALAARAQPERVAEGTAAMISVFESTYDFYRIASCSELLDAFANKIDAPTALRAWKACRPFLEREVSNDVDEEVSLVVEDTLVALIPRLDHRVHSAEWQTIIDVVQKPDQHPHRIRSAGRVLIALAANLQGQDADALAESFAGLMQLSTDADVLSIAVHGLAMSPAKIGPEQLTRSWDAMIAVLEKSMDSDAQEAAGNGLVALAPRLSPEQVTHGGDALIAVLEKAESSTSVEAVGKGLVALAPRLSPEQITRDGDALIAILETADFFPAASAAGNGLAALAPRLSPAQRTRTGEAMVAWLPRVAYGPITDELLALMPHLEPKTQDRLASDALRIVSDYLASSASYFTSSSDGTDLDAFRPAIMAMNNPQSLARLMQHPACISEPRDWMLQRFEELVLHDGRRVFLKLPLPSEPVETETPTTPEPSDPAPPRRFHTFHDAADWIQQNWPDFDLEATHPVTWRGEP